MGITNASLSWGISRGVQYLGTNSWSLVSNYEAVNVCAGTNVGVKTLDYMDEYFFKRNELTNSTEASATDHPKTGGYYSRAVDSFMGEWDDMSKYDSLLSSPLSDNKAYWTSEGYNVGLSTYKYVVSYGNGNVQASSLTQREIAFCKKVDQ